jgi:hypothetical protein
MGAEQLARVFVGEEIGGLIDWQTILATIIQPHGLRQRRPRLDRQLGTNSPTTSAPLPKHREEG